MAISKNPLETQRVHVYNPGTHRIWSVPLSALPSDMICVTMPDMPEEVWVDIDHIRSTEEAKNQKHELRDWVKSLPAIGLAGMGLLAAAYICITASNAYLAGHSALVLPQEPGMLALLTSAGCLGVFAYFRNRIPH